MNTPVCYCGVRLGENRNHVFRVDGDGRTSPLLRRYDLRRHAGAFDWGANNAGAAQLAVSMLADLVDDETALDWYQEFKSQVLNRLPSSWVLEVNDVAEWMLGQDLTIREIQTLDRATGVLKGGAA